MQYDEGARVFFNSPEHGWVLGTVAAYSGRKYCCVAMEEGIATNLDPSDIVAAQDSMLHQKVSDLRDLATLHEAAVLQNLRRRHASGHLHTWAADNVLLSFTPADGTAYRYDPTEPHPFALATRAAELSQTMGPQAVVFSGDSGAGKSEMCRQVADFLLHGTRAAADLNDGLLILDAFGSASTLRGDRCSRYMKAIRLHGLHRTSPSVSISFSPLQPGRVVHAPVGERVYHALYLAVRGRLAPSLLLEGDAKYRYLTSGHRVNSAVFDTSEHFDQVTQALLNVGFSHMEMVNIWQIVAGVLHLGNVAFESYGDVCVVSPHTEADLSRACGAWQVSCPALLDQLPVREDHPHLRLYCTPFEAADQRDRLAQYAYCRMFEWIGSEVQRYVSRGPAPDEEEIVTLLDIFGFQDMSVNSLEELCINTACEALHAHFQAATFSKEVEECMAEGVDVSWMSYPDNSPCLDLLAGPQGILNRLDQETRSEDAVGEQRVLDEVEARLDPSTRPFFIRHGATAFTIRHFSGDVRYEASGFLRKNSPLALRRPVQAILCASSNVVLASLAREEQTIATNGSIFRMHVASYLEEIAQSSCHFVRCLKPHPLRAPGMINGPMVMHQLSCHGVLGTVMLSRMGYARKLGYDAFYRSYRIIAEMAGKATTKEDLRGACRTILELTGLGAEYFVPARNRVLINDAGYKTLEGLRGVASANPSACIQAFARTYRAKLLKRFLQWQKAAALIQHEVRDAGRRTLGISEVQARKQDADRRLKTEQELSAVQGMRQCEFDESAMRCVVVDEELGARLKMQEWLAACVRRIVNLYIKRLDDEEYFQRVAVMDAERWEMRDLSRQLAASYATASLFQLQLYETAKRTSWVQLEDDGRNTLWAIHSCEVFSFFCRGVAGRTSEEEHRGYIEADEEKARLKIHIERHKYSLALHCRSGEAAEAESRAFIEGLEASDRKHLQSSSEEIRRKALLAKGFGSEGEARKAVVREEAAARAEMMRHFDGLLNLLENGRFAQTELSFRQIIEHDRRAEMRLMWGSWLSLQREWLESGSAIWSEASQRRLLRKQERRERRDLHRVFAYGVEGVIPGAAMHRLGVAEKEERLRVERAWQQQLAEGHEAALLRITQLGLSRIHDEQWQQRQIIAQNEHLAHKSHKAYFRLLREKVQQQQYMKSLSRQAKHRPHTPSQRSTASSRTPPQYPSSLSATTASHPSIDPARPFYSSRTRQDLIRRDQDHFLMSHSFGEQNHLPWPGEAFL